MLSPEEMRSAWEVSPGKSSSRRALRPSSSSSTEPRARGSPVVSTLEIPTAAAADTTAKTAMTAILRPGPPPLAPAVTMRATARSAIPGRLVVRPRSTRWKAGIRRSVTPRAVGMEMTAKRASCCIPGKDEVATRRNAATVVPQPRTTGRATAARARDMRSLRVPDSWCSAR